MSTYKYNNSLKLIYNQNLGNYFVEKLRPGPYYRLYTHAFVNLFIDQASDWNKKSQVATACFLAAKIAGCASIKTYFPATIS